MNGHDQTIGGINCVLGDPGWGGRLIKSDTPATLMIEDTADHVAKSFITGPVSVVYNPAGFHRLTLSNSTYAATGDLVISNGAVRLVSGASYPNANEIRICPGAAFELETTVTASLKDVGKITVEAGGTFRFLSSLASSFDVGLVEFNVASGATIDVAGEVSIMEMNLKIDGARPVCGRYQALDGTDETATKVPWISGAGVLGLNVGYTRWKSASDGTWGAAANWDDGLPDADTGALIDADGAGYTVSVDANPGTQTNIIIRNSGPYTTTVNVTAPMTIADGVLQLLNGARLRIGAGGSVLHNHDDPTVYTYAEGTSSKIRISAGTELSLESGGSFKATNFVGRLIVEGAEGNPARIKVDSGNFSFHTASSVNPRMILGPYSELLVTNTGLFHIDSTKDGSKYPPFYQAGGMIDVSGDSTFTVGRTKARPFGTGTTTFRGNALLTVDEGLFDQKYYPDIYIGPSCNCETSTVVFTDHAKFYTAKFSSLTRFRVGDDSPLAEENAITNGLAVLRYDSDSYSRFGSYFTVGSDYCRGELYLNSGSMSVTYGSLEVGGGNYEYRRDRSDAHGEGLMAVNGGTFDVRALNGHVDSIIQGLIVGAGWESKLDGNSFYRGRLELNSGIVRSNTDAANVIVGAGRAKGEIVQNGGTFEHKRAERNFAMAIGFSGGDGSYVITGGTATVKSDLYVGGVLPSTFNYTLDYCPNNHDAVGLLSVRGGTFSVVSNLVLSADGAGTLEIGGAGLLTVGGDLVLSNCTETASVATLKYTFGASGVGSLSVGGDIVVASGSKLVVDMSEYTGPLKTFQLLDLSSAEGTFSDIEFVKPSVEGGNRLTLDVDADGIRVRTNHKTLIMIY